MKASLSCCSPWTVRSSKWLRGDRGGYRSTRASDPGARPHGIGYALVLRPKAGGSPWVHFDNAHAIDEKGRGYRRKRAAYGHWHRTAKDRGRPYDFTTAGQLLDDFWREVRRTLDEKGIPSGL